MAIEVGNAKFELELPSVTNIGDGDLGDKDTWVHYTPTLPPLDKYMILGILAEVGDVMNWIQKFMSYLMKPFTCIETTGCIAGEIETQGKGKLYRANSFHSLLLYITSTSKGYKDIYM